MSPWTSFDVGNLNKSRDATRAVTPRGHLIGAREVGDGQAKKNQTTNGLGSREPMYLHSRDI